MSAAVKRCWSQLQHTASWQQQTKLNKTFCKMLCSHWSVHYEPVCALKYEGKTETLGKDLLTQFTYLMISSWFLTVSLSQSSVGILFIANCLHNVSHLRSRSYRVILNFLNFCKDILLFLRRWFCSPGAFQSEALSCRCSLCPPCWHWLNCLFLLSSTIYH